VVAGRFGGGEGWWQEGLVVGKIDGRAAVGCEDGLRCESARLGTVTLFMCC